MMPPQLRDMLLAQAAAGADGSPAATLATSTSRDLPLEHKGSETRALWGGAMQVHVPRRFVDVSGFRQVPNHQEVLVDASSDQSVICELLDWQDKVEDEDAARFFFQNLGEDNEAARVQVDDAGVLEAAQVDGLRDEVERGEVYASYARGTQWVGKYKEEEALNEVAVYVASLRMRSVKTELVISVNTPRKVSEASSSSELTVLSEEETAKLIADVLASFKINSLEIFSG